MAGRPTKFKPELGVELERRLAAGLSLRAASAEVGASPRTASRWLKTGLVQRPEPPGVEVLDAPTDSTLQDRLLAAQPGFVATLVRAAAHDWRAALAILERVAPAEWRLPERRTQQPSSRTREPAPIWREIDEPFDLSTRRERESSRADSCRGLRSSW